MKLQFVDADNAELHRLADALDEYYFSLVGEVHRRYAKYNDPHLFAARVVAYDTDGAAMGCGCWKRVDEQTAEIKRIYIEPAHRRKGVASAIIRELEQDIARAGCKTVILETARTTGDSEALYLSLGYEEIPYYGSPAGADNCRCFRKEWEDKA